MATYKVLGQAYPASATPTALYTVPSATQAIVSTVTVCNQASVADTFRISVEPDGVSASAQHYVAYDADIAANTTAAFTLGLTLGDTDVITVYSAGGGVSFGAFGSEIA